MRIIVISILIVTFSFTAKGQELYWVNSNVENNYKKKGLYYPEHSLEFKNGAVFDKGKLIFTPYLSKVYNYNYEIFEDLEKKQYLIVTQIFADRDNFPSPEGIIRDLIYIVKLDNEYPVYYTKLFNGVADYSNGLMISTKEGYEDYDCCNRIKEIDTDNMELILVSKKNDDTEYYRSIKLHKLDDEGR